MAEQVQVVQPNDKGQVELPIPRSGVEKVDIIDIDLVVTTKNGDRLIMPGVAMEAMTQSPPQIKFSDGVVGAGDLVARVARIETPSVSIPIMTSLTAFDQKKTEGRKNLTKDGAEADQASQSGAQTAQAQQVAPLPTNGTDSAIDKLNEKAEDLDNAMRKGAFDPSPVKPVEVLKSSSPETEAGKVTSKIPLYTSLSEGNVVGVKTTGTVIAGAGGPSGSSSSDGVQTRDALQYGKETLSGTAGDDIILADGFHQLANGGNSVATYATLNSETGTTSSSFYYAKEIVLNVAGYVRRLDSVTLSGLPTGVTIEGATDQGGGVWSIPTSSVIPTAKSLTLVYDVTALRALFSSGADYVDLKVTVTITGQGSDVINVSKVLIFRFQDVDSESDVTDNSPVYITGAGGGWTDIYVFPTASAPHLINAGEGNNTIYGGNSADTINAGSGDDVIYAYAGNDVISAGAGANTVWAGNGDDTVTSGAGNDIIHAGAGANVVDAGDGVNSVDAGTGNDTITTGSGSDTISASDGANIIAAGDGANIVTTGSGNDTITTGSGNDTISASDGTNILNVGNGNNSVTGGSGIDAIVGGNGIDSFSAGAGNDILYGGTGNNILLDGGDGTDWLTFNGAPTTLTGDSALADWLAAAGTDINGVTFTANASGGGTATRANESNTDIIANIENIIGSQGNDSFDFSAFTSIAHTLYGLGGNDTLIGSSLADILYGGAGQDSLLGGAGNDLIYTSATMVGSTAVSGVGTDSAGAGTLSATISATGLSVTLTDITNYANGGAGADTIIGGDGNDLFIATVNEYTDGTNVDSFSGGSGTDTLDFSSYSSSTALDVDLSQGIASTGTTTWARFESIERVLTGAANDTVTGTSAGETIWTGDGNDLVYANGGDDVVWGGAGNDDLRAGAGTDSLYGEAGNDTLRGSTGTSYLNGGAGTNAYYLYGGVNTVDGTSGTDTVYYSDAAVVGAVSGGVNYGVFVNLSSTDYGISSTGALVANATQSYWLNNSGGWTLMSAYNGSQWLADNDGRGFYGNAQNDRFIVAENVLGTGYNDVIIGNALDNWIFAGNGNDVVYALEGADTFAMMTGGATNYGNDDLDGGNNVAGTADAYTLTTTTAGVLSWTGGDLITYSSGNNINASLLINLDTVSHNVVGVTGSTVAANTITGWSTYVVSIFNTEHAYGGNYGDFIYGSAANNILDGGAGDDTLFGYDGDDYLYAGAGRDYVDGGNGVDWASFRTISASTTHATYGSGFGVEVYLTNADLDASGADDQSGTWASYQARYATGTNSYDYDTLVSIENIDGTDYNDRLAGDTNANMILGESGNDLIYGGAHGAGTIDTLDGGNGTDTLWFYGFDASGSGVRVDLSTSNGETILGSTGWSSATINDGGTTRMAVVRNFENIQGTADGDHLTGTTGVNTLWGGGGNDTLYGLAGNDTLYGDAGNDFVDGGLGNDTVYGGAGSDTLTGGGGTDVVYGDADSDTFQITSSQVSTLMVYGGSGNASATTSTENGTDTIYFSDNWNFSTIASSTLTSRFHSIEAIDLRNGGSAVTVTLFSASGSAAAAKTIIDGVLDSSSNTSLHLYLDNGDVFNTTYSNAGAGTASNTNAQATYTYGTSSLVVHWGSG